MSGIATAIVVGGLGSAYLGSQASKSAGDTQAAASDRASQVQLDMYNQSRNDLAPYRFVGGQSLNTLAGASGLAQDPSVGGTTGSFQTSPGYNFVRSEGQRGLERSAAARGGAFSGPALRALDTYNTGLASQEYGNWWNRMAGLAGVGQTATNTGGVLGANTATGVANSLQNAGSARASGVMGSANSIAGGINSGIGNYLMYKGGGFNGWGGTGGYTPYVAPNTGYINTSLPTNWLG
jgi:hypothetical protein